MFTIIVGIIIVGVVATAFRNPNFRASPYGGPESGDGQLFSAGDTLAVFEQPQNGFRERVPRNAWLYMMFFGIFYLMARQLWMHVAIVAAVIIVTAAVSGWLMLLVGLPLWLFYVGNISKLIIANYYRRGWKLVALEEATFVPEVAENSI